MLSVSPERPIDPLAIEILIQVNRVALELGLEYFVTGATARDILLNGVFGLDTGRGTKDIDLAIALDGWRQFDAVKSRLIETESFAIEEGAAQRLFYRKRTGGGGYPLDLLPFGDIEGRPDQIAWPPDLSVVMNVAGYREAFAAAVEVEVQSRLVVRVASLPGLSILKVFAWADRGAANSKDALDLAVLLSQYSAAGNEDRLFNEELELLEDLGHDLDLAGPRLLGKDAARVAKPETRAKLLVLLDDPTRLRRLVRDMAGAFRGTADPIAKAEAAIAQFKAGLRAN